MSKFDESKIKRDSGGKFGSGGSSGSEKKPQAKRRTDEEIKDLKKSQKKDHKKSLETVSGLKDEIKRLQKMADRYSVEDKEHGKLHAKAEKLQTKLDKLKSKNSLDLYHEKQLECGKNRYGS